MERLRGMFAFGIWTESKRCLVLCRDRLGIKPLYIHQRGADIYFGSELKTLFVHDEIVIECDAGRADETAAWLKRAMVDGMAPLVDPVPVEVEVSSGPTWGG